MKTEFFIMRPGTRRVMSSHLTLKAAKLALEQSAHGCIIRRGCLVRGDVFHDAYQTTQLFPIVFPTFTRRSTENRRHATV